MTAVTGTVLAVALFVVLFLRERARLLGDARSRRTLGFLALPLLVIFAVVILIRFLALL